MSKVVLHIGTHKTATTTIQDMFHKNAPLLAQHGLIYPHLGRVTGHHGLVYDWSRLPPVYKPDIGSLDLFSQIARDHAGKDATVFLSSEEFSRDVAGASVDFAAVRERLEAFDEIEVICVLRTQWQFLQSIYLELSRSSSPLRPSQITEPAIKGGNAMSLMVDYNLILDRLEKVFAPEEITLLDYNVVGQGEGRILGAVLRHLGIDLKVDALELVNDGFSNISPHPLASWVSNIMAEPQKAPTWLVDCATEAFREEMGPDIVSCLFTQSEFDVLEKHFAPLNDRLAERRQAVQPGFSITPPDCTPIKLFRNQVHAPVWAKLTRILVRERMRAQK
jgi:hypothetical protein